jgi:hypothetical protein
LASKGTWKESPQTHSQQSWESNPKDVIRLQNQWPRLAPVGREQLGKKITPDLPLRLTVNPAKQKMSAVETPA